MKSRRPFARSAPSKPTVKHEPKAMDLEGMLDFSRQLYAHALTLQEVIRNDGEIAYKDLRPRCELQAAQQFEIFFHGLKRHSRLRNGQVSGQRFKNSPLFCNNPGIA